ncbi:hypothetical protein Poly59_30880 [Rubripirellula reticaptiva]|uniref:Knr4/Smi1-like domain-containing protein n=2 Tax=Rubripirellula reticaptiva TaxID=2528013 RepID=A0A5C6EV32_9BACT|nr:hypothetical protein Poly59_30880 [Rubripirellula reticaptiva]
MIAELKKLAQLTNSILRPPASDATLELLKSSYSEIPALLVELLSFADGEQDSSFKSNGIIAFEAFISAEEIAREHDFVTSYEYDDLNQFVECDRINQRPNWHSGLIPISFGYDLHCVCIDMNPGPAGRVGQILGLRPICGNIQVIANDLEALIQKTLAIYDARSVDVSDPNCLCLTLDDFPPQ